MDNHSEKKLAPIIVTILLTIYYLVFFGLITACVPGVLKIPLGIIPLILVAILLHVCRERLDEIDGGEEDDLSKY